MSASDKCEALDNWKQGKVKVMVCTSTYGMKIDKPDVETVICVGSLEVRFRSLAGQEEMETQQKVHKSNREIVSNDNRKCPLGILFHQESDIQQASFWCKSAPETEVLQPFKEM